MVSSDIGLWITFVTCCASSADSGAALHLLGGQRPLRRPAQSQGEEVHHAGVATPLPHPGHQVASGRWLPGSGMLWRLRLRLADGYRWEAGDCRFCPLTNALKFSYRSTLKREHVKRPQIFCRNSTERETKSKICAHQLYLPTRAIN